MSIFHSLIKDIWEGYFAFKGYLVQWEKARHLAPKDYPKGLGEERKRLNEKGERLREELSRKKELIQKELKNIKKNTEDLVSLREKIGELLELIPSVESAFRTDGDFVEKHGLSDSLPLMEKNIPRINDILNTCHNLLSVINKDHRLLRREERDIEK